MTGLAVLLCAALASPPEGPSPAPAVALPPVAAPLHRRRVRTQLAGMGALTGWAAANIVGGVVGNFTATGEARYFHQMNALWNTVNLAIGAVGLASARRERARGPRRDERREVLRAMATFSINAGLDVLYIMAGVTTLELGRVHERPRLVGYGESVILQGAFLLAFDAALVAAHGASLRRLRPHAALAPGGGALLGLRAAF